MGLRRIRIRHKEWDASYATSCSLIFFWWLTKMIWRWPLACHTSSLSPYPAKSSFLPVLASNCCVMNYLNCLTNSCISYMPWLSAVLSHCPSCFVSSQGAHRLPLPCLPYDTARHPAEGPSSCLLPGRGTARIWGRSQTWLGTSTSRARGLQKKTRLISLERSRPIKTGPRKYQHQVEGSGDFCLFV